MVLDGTGRGCMMDDVIPTCAISIWKTNYLLCPRSYRIRETVLCYDESCALDSELGGGGTKRRRVSNIRTKIAVAQLAKSQS